MLSDLKKYWKSVERKFVVANSPGDHWSENEELLVILLSWGRWYLHCSLSSYTISIRSSVLIRSFLIEQMKIYLKLSTTKYGRCQCSWMYSFLIYLIFSPFIQ
jgi:hypothetical protein